jgi:hypothetical protein
MEAKGGSERGSREREPDDGMVEDACTALAGALALVVLEFYIKEPSELEPKKFTLENLNPDGKTYRARDVRRDVMLERDVVPGELTVGLAMRKRDDPMIGLLRRARLDARPFLEPRAERPRSALEDFNTPESGFERGIGGRSESPFVRGPSRHGQRPFQTWHQGRELPTTENNWGFRGIQPRGVMHGGLGQQHRMTPPRYEPPGVQHAPGAYNFGGYQGGPPGETAERQWPREEYFGRYRGGIEFGDRIGGRRRWQPEPMDLEQVGVGAAERGRGRGGVEPWEQMGGLGDRRMGGDRAEEEWGQRRRRFEAKERGRLIGEERSPPTPFRPTVERFGGGVGPEVGAIGARRESRERAAGVVLPKEVEDRFAALKSMRRTEMVRSATSSELRRMLSAISPAEHPGIFTTVDQFVTMYECPPLHRRPMCVAGACGGVLKEPHIKLAFLAEATWQFGRRKCAEAGENLTDQQIGEIEAQILEFYGKQRVEGSKILDKAGIVPGKGGK